MQTFLPFADFAKSAAVLDRQRLGKQRLENMQLLKALLIPGSGWANHPAAKMWRGHEWSLLDYHAAIIYEWHNVRGYKDTTYIKAHDIMSDAVFLHDWYGDTIDPPAWLGDPAFHRAHQSNLIRKDPDLYEPLFPGVPPDLEYVWPVS